MDANGLKFWMLPRPVPWALDQAVELDEQQHLRLASRRQLPPWTTTAMAADEAIARAQLNRRPQARDAFGHRAFWDEAAGQVKAVGVTPEPIVLYQPETSVAPTDLAMGYDGVLYLAIAGQVRLIDTRDRWQPVTVALAGFNAWRLAAAPDGGVWVLDQNDANPAQRQLGRVAGSPWPRRPSRLRSSAQFRPCIENPQPPWLEPVWAGSFSANEELVALASNVQGQLLGLSWVAGQAARVRYFQHGQRDRTWSAPVALSRLSTPYSLTWVDGQHIALLSQALPTEAAVYRLPAAADLTHSAGDDSAPLPLDPIGNFYPLRHHDGGPFLQGVTLPPHYVSQAPAAAAPSSLPLVPLSLPALTKQGEASAALPFDSGDAQTVWHRLYLEAVVPPGCGIQIYLAASDERDFPDESNWFEHRLGHPPGQPDSGIPLATWMPLPSEIPFHPGLLPCPSAKDHSGLFTVLIQRQNRRVRSLKGRYLWVRVRLSGTGRSTPELAALRAYAPRFSYVDRYLPELYQETEFGPEADKLDNSTPADFLERFLNNFEGILTPLEDRIAQAYRLTQPQTAPAEALEWLGSWLGVTLESAYPQERFRALLSHTPELYRRRGTLRGLQLALEVATDGAISQGRVIVMEDFRLRRTFATILGGDLAAATDPLLQGLTVSGNSIVGDSLILSDDENQELLALFEATAIANDSEAEAVAAFFAALAYRVTVLVHQTVEPEDLGLIRRVAELETPAHLRVRVVTARLPLMVSVAALVGLDTYLGPPESPDVVQLGRSPIGLRDLVQRPASLDPRLAGSAL